MLEQRLAAELGEHIDRIDSGIDEMLRTKSMIRYLPPKEPQVWRVPRKWKQPGSFATGEHDAQKRGVYGSLHDEGGFSFRGHNFRQSALTKTFLRQDITRGSGLESVILNSFRARSLVRGDDVYSYLWKADFGVARRSPPSLNYTAW